MSLFSVKKYIAQLNMKCWWHPGSVHCTSDDRGQFGQSPQFEVLQTPIAAQQLVAEDERIQELVLVTFQALDLQVC